MSPTSVTKIKNIDHLGIVAGLIDEIGIVEIINSKLGTDPRKTISVVTLVKAIFINRLGFGSRPLYLFSQFFEEQGIEILLGEEVKEDYINDEQLGRGMDKFYRSSLNNLFIEIVLAVIKKFQIDTKYSHGDVISYRWYPQHTHSPPQEPQP